MWNSLGHKHYIFKKEKLENGCDIYMSDFVHLWIKRLRNEEIMAVSKEMNPRIEAPELKLIDKVLSLFDGNAVSNKIVIENNEQINLYLESDISGVKFNFKVKLELQNTDMFFKEITLPFMLLAARLQIRENKLVDIILKKDAEINEYKRENELIKRTHLITKEFNRCELMEGEMEELSSSFVAIMNNPSTILNIIDAAMFQSTKSHNNDEISNQGVEIDDVNSNSVIKIKTKRRDMNIRKNKNRIDLNIIAGSKKKRDKIYLKF